MTKTKTKKRPSPKTVRTLTTAQLGNVTGGSNKIFVGGLGS